MTVRLFSVTYIVSFPEGEKRTLPRRGKDMGELPLTNRNVRDGQLVMTPSLTLRVGLFSLHQRDRISRRGRRLNDLQIEIGGLRDHTLQSKLGLDQFPAVFTDMSGSEGIAEQFENAIG